jgi:polysaccharide biosynthesis/export protein
MRINASETFKTSLAVISLVLSLSSCMNMRKFVYFNDLQDTLIRNRGAMEPVIQKNDLLSIAVTSLSPEASSIFNAPNEGTNHAGSFAGNSLPVGYLVNQDGYIQYPLLDSIHAAGLTKKQLTNYIEDLLRKKNLLVDPIVTIRYLNFKVSVLGEVAKPGVMTIPNEKVTILEALGLAGDMTIYARRDNILLIREEETGEKIVRLSLSNGAILRSPYYYLRSNDVIYVEPNKNKVTSVSNTLQVLPAVIAAISLLIVAADRIK